MTVNDHQLPTLSRKNDAIIKVSMPIGTTNIFSVILTLWNRIDRLNRGNESTRASDRRGALT